MSSTGPNGSMWVPPVPSYEPPLDSARVKSSRGLWKKLIFTLVVCCSLTVWLGWNELHPGFRHDSFVRVQGGRLVVGCRPFVIAGFNGDNLAEAYFASGARSIAGGGVVRDLMRKAASSGLNVVRVFAHTTDPDRPVRRAPGKYDERALRAMDAVVAEAERAGLRVILSLMDNWKYAGGVDEVVDWSGGAGPRPAGYALVDADGDVSVEGWSDERRLWEARRKASFFTDPRSRELYLEHARTVLTRKNSQSSKVYGQDPTVLALDLINEPRCSTEAEPECDRWFQAWVADMAREVRALAPDTLLTIGSEGFWGAGNASGQALGKPEDTRDPGLNPGAAQGSDWAATTGQDLLSNYAVPELDFVTLHLWPDNWKVDNATEFALGYIAAHVGESRLSGKPVLIEEFGRKVEPTRRDLASRKRAKKARARLAKRGRDPTFVATYNMVEDHFERLRGARLAGSLFWRWGFNAWDASKPAEYGILPGDSTFEIAAAHGARTQRWMSSQPREPGACRAEERPAACYAPRDPAAHWWRACDAQPTEECGREGAGPTYPLREDCCLVGLGAFQDGCSAWW